MKGMQDENLTEKLRLLKEVNEEIKEVNEKMEDIFNDLADGNSRLSEKAKEFFEQKKIVEKLRDEHILSFNEFKEFAEKTNVVVDKIRADHLKMSKDYKKSDDDEKKNLRKEVNALVEKMKGILEEQTKIGENLKKAYERHQNALKLLKEKKSDMVKEIIASESLCNEKHAKLAKKLEGLHKKQHDLLKQNPKSDSLDKVKETETADYKKKKRKM